jgi:enterochelin esterase family protein
MDTGHDHPTASPLFEAIPGDPEHVLATVFWRGEAERVAVLGPGRWEVPANLMARDGASELWRRSYRIPSDLRTTYLVLPDPPDQLDFTPALFARFETDPLNPNVWIAPADEEDPEWGFETRRSVLEGPAAPAQPWIEPDPATPRGSVELHRLRSELLGNERRVWAYTPPGYDPSERYGVLVLFDGWAYVHLVPAPTILDNLLAAGRIAPLVALLPDSLDQDTRNLELPCHRPFVDFLTEELLPWAGERWSLTRDPGRIVAAGSSFGGLAAVFAAFERPDVFGSALSQSGSFGWAATGPDDEFLTERVAAAEHRPFRAWLEIGSLENRDRPDGGPSGLASNRRLRDELRAKGTEVIYSEYSGGHDYVCWRGSLADGLIALAPRD